jgi:prolyl oligopeptidase
MIRRPLAVVAILAPMLSAADFTPPPTRTEPVTEVLHGVSITDPYRWLENQEAPATREWLAAQDKFTRAYLEALPGRDALRRKLDALIRIDSVGTPTLRKGRYFFSRRLATEDRRSLCKREGFTGKDEVLIAPADVSTDPAASVFYMSFTADGAIAAYGMRMGGEDESDIRFLDVATRKTLPDRLPRARYIGLALTPDKKGAYYGIVGGAQGSRVWYHAMGTPASSDREVFGQGYGALDFVVPEVSPDGRWLAIGVYQGSPPKRTDIFLQDLKSNGPIRPILKEDAEVGTEFAGDYLLLISNAKSPNRKIMRVELANPAPDRWKLIVPEGKLAIDGVSAVGHRVFVSYLEDVHTRIRQFDIDGKSLGDLKVPGLGTVSVPRGQWEEDEAFFGFSSFVDPGTTFRLAIATDKREVWFKPRIPIDTGNIETKQVWYTSKDGTKVPMFVVQKRGMALDGERPTWLTAYGGFNLALTPGFSAVAAWWVERGGVFAQPNLRGGGEFGENWHSAGMFEKKQNVFDDFIGAAEWLIKNKYTKPEKLAVQGGSNGGLLMGAMMTQRPELFGAIVCGAPLLDMLRFHKLSIGSIWAAEYGSAEEAKQFEYLRKYSPYHNVKSGTKFPAILFMTGDADTRVDPAHARKMTALVQAANASNNPVMLRYDTKGGHSGIGNVSKNIEELVDEIGFLAARVGLKVE